MKERTCNLDDFPLSKKKDNQGLKFWFGTQNSRMSLPALCSILVY